MKYALGLALVAALYCGGCATIPQDVAMGSNASPFGLVYTGKLVRVERAYMTSSYGGDTRFDASASSATLLLAHLAKKDENTYLTSAASDFAAALSGETEGFFRSRYCQYYISVADTELIEAMKSNSSSSSDSEQNKLDQYRELQNIREQLSSLQTDPESEDFDYTKSQIRDLNQQLQDVFLKLEDANRAPKSRVISVINPCRNFKIGATIEISKYQDQVILEQAIAPESKTSRNRQWDGMIATYRAVDGK